MAQNPSAWASNEGEHPSESDSIPTLEHVVPPAFTHSTRPAIYEDHVTLAETSGLGNIYSRLNEVISELGQLVVQFVLGQVMQGSESDSVAVLKEQPGRSSESR